MMRSGNLRHRVQLETPSGSSDGAGGIALAWTLVDTLWAEIRSASGSEQLNFGRANATLMNNVRIRYRSDITPDMRFSLGSRIFEIRRVADPDGRKQWIECICEERLQ